MCCFVSKTKTSLSTQQCLFGVTELDYYGFHISAQGISPDKNRIHVIKQMQPPSTATEARCFLGLVNIVAHFVPNLAAMTEPIRRITHKNHPWLWVRVTSYLATLFWPVLTPPFPPRYVMTPARLESVLP